MEDVKKAKDQILHVLKVQGAQTATALADELQVSPMAIRQHLQTLKAEQWVTYREERRPMGRPVKLWQLTEQSAERFPNRHADLMVDLLRSIQTVFGSDGVDKLVTERSQRQIQTYQSKLTDLVTEQNWQHQVRAIAQLRTQEGYMAEVIDQPDGNLLLIENHCPICTAAQNCQQLCGAELEVFKAILGEAIAIERVEHILEGDRRCAYLVRRRAEG
jgi:iron-sulfur cluster biosynthesis transcriptional regulator SufR